MKIKLPLLICCITSFLCAILFLNAQEGITQSIYEPLKFPVPEREPGQTHVLKLACEPIPTVRIGIIGLGMRGKGAVTRIMSIEDAEIKAICDLEQFNLDVVQKNIKENKHSEVDEYTGETGWQELCKREDIDLIYICTDWYSHVPVAIFAMEHNKHVAIEVPAAITLDQCWQLVNTAEKTRRHCTMLENCCYDRFELATRIIR